MASSTFIKYFQSSVGNALLGANIWLVPQANEYPTNAVELTADGTKDGVYYRENVPDGEYKIYIDPSGGTSPTLVLEKYWIGEQRITDFMNLLNSVDNEMVFLNGKKQFSVPTINKEADYIWTGNHTFNKSIQFGNALREDIANTTPFEINASLYNLLILNPTVANANVLITDPLSTQKMLVVNRNGTNDLGGFIAGYRQPPNTMFMYLYDQVSSTWRIEGLITLTEALLSLSDVVTGNVSTSKHGFVPRLPNDATKFLNGLGLWATPESGGSGETSAIDYFPTGGAVYRDYKDTIPAGQGYCKELLPPRPDPATAGYQTAEFEDCSELFHPTIIEVGDFYFMYYTGSTQKYQTDPIDSTTDRRKSDFQRNNQTFLAWKRKEEGLCGGGWHKYQEGRTPVIPIDTNIYGAGYEVGRVWLRSVIWSNILNKYVCAYNCDANYDGSTHESWWAFATSNDGISWTKLLQYFSFNGVGSAWHSGALVEVGNYFYLYTSSASSLHIDLYRSRDLITWELVTESIISASLATGCWGAKVIDDVVYVTGATGAGAATTAAWVKLFSVPTGAIEFPEGYVDNGVLYTGNVSMGEDNAGAVNWTDIFKVDTAKWLISYNYYKNRFARYDVVREVGIRQFSFGAPIPHPTATPSYLPISTISKTADEQVVDSNVLQDDNHLVLTAVAAGTYKIRLDIAGNQTNSSRGIKLTILAPAGTTINGTNRRTTVNAATWATDPCTNLTVLASSISWSGATDHFLILTGTIILTNPGDVKIQWAQQAAGGTMTFKQYSSLTLLKIA